jgi:mycofactocin precursor
MALDAIEASDTARGRFREDVAMDTTTTQTDAAEVEAESLVEEVSIDGMCGVY